MKIQLFFYLSSQYHPLSPAESSFICAERTACPCRNRLVEKHRWILHLLYRNGFLKRRNQWNRIVDFIYLIGINYLIISAFFFFFLRTCDCLYTTLPCKRHICVSFSILKSVSSSLPFQMSIISPILPTPVSPLLPVMLSSFRSPRGQLASNVSSLNSAVTSCCSPAGWAFLLQHTGKAENI